MTAEEKINMGILDAEEFRQTSPFTGHKCTKRHKSWLKTGEVDQYLSLYVLVNGASGVPIGNEEYTEYIDIKTHEHYLIKTV